MLLNRQQSVQPSCCSSRFTCPARPATSFACRVSRISSSLQPGRCRPSQLVPCCSSKPAPSKLDSDKRPSQPSISSSSIDGDDPELPSTSFYMKQQQQQLQATSSSAKAIAPSYEALAAWVCGAGAFGALIWYTQGLEKAQEFFAGYLLEQSLSVDNLFVFILVFSYFKTPANIQPKVLTYGILTAAVLRAIMIILGVEILTNFDWVLALFAAFLIFSSYQLLTGEEDEDEDLTDNFIVQTCKRWINTTDAYDGDRFFTLRNGIKVATPLLLVLAVIEISDVVFAVDSIPAVFGITLDPFIVYTSNIFAILSLRALYGFVSTVMSELRFLEKAVALVLGFIGTKMLLGFGGVIIPTDVSLLVVGTTLGTAVGASLLLPAPKEEKKDE